MDNRQIVCQNMIWNKKARTYLRTHIFHCLHTKVNSSCWKPQTFTCCYRSYEFIWISGLTRTSHTIHHLMQIIKILVNVELRISSKLIDLHKLNAFWLCKVYYHLSNLFSFSTSNWNVYNILMYQLPRSDDFPRNILCAYVL